VIEIVRAHTADLDAAVLRAARELLDEAFADDPLTDEDWEHCLGGVHLLGYVDGALAGHAAVVARRLLHGGRALRTGYVEGVATRPGVRGRGCGAAVMEAAESVVRGAYELGALASTDLALGFYAARGWQLWLGPAAALTPAGIVRTPDADGCVFVLPGPVPLDLGGELVADWRDGEVW
jgi:aminoglycoside 2'-N-acetyltransferase I